MSLDTEAIAARLKNATPGPWDWEYGVSQRTAWALIRQTSGPNPEYILRFAGPNDIEICPDPENDMDLIAHAPGDIASLLAEVARLKAALEPIARAIELMDAGLSPDELCSDDDRLRVRAGDLRRARAALQAVEETP